MSRIRERFDMSRLTPLVAIMALTLGAGPALACTPPPPQCKVPNGQIAILQTFNGTAVMFSQHDPTAPVFRLTHVLVECSTRRAVALSHLRDETDDAAYQAHAKGRDLISDVARTDAHPKLGQLHRQLQRLGLSSKRFTLKAAHCGRDLPDTPPPVFSCPSW